MLDKVRAYRLRDVERVEVGARLHVEVEIGLVSVRIAGRFYRDGAVGGIRSFAVAVLLNGHRRRARVACAPER